MLLYLNFRSAPAVFAFSVSLDDLGNVTKGHFYLSLCTLTLLFLAAVVWLSCCLFLIFYGKMPHFFKWPQLDFNSSTVDAVW